MTEETTEARIEAEEEARGEPVDGPQKTGTSMSGDRGHSPHAGHSPGYSDKNGSSSVDPLPLKESQQGSEHEADRARSGSPHAPKSPAAPAGDIVGDSDGINSASPATDKATHEEGRVKQSEIDSCFTSATSEDSLIRMETSFMLESSCKDSPASHGECKIQDAKELKGAKEHDDESKADKEGDGLEKANRGDNADMQEDTPVEKKDDDNTDMDQDTPVEKEGDSDTQNSSVTAMETDDNDSEPKVTIASVESIGSKMTDPSASGSSNTETANNLDEMMDMGTVDEVEQEAQMAVEEQDGGSSSELSIVNTGLDKAADLDKPDSDEKPTVSPAPVKRDQSEDDKVPGEGTTTSGDDSKSLIEAQVDSKSEPKAEEKQSPDTGQKSLDPDAAKPDAGEVKPPMSPEVLVKVKDEPMDEEYERALNSSTALKDEPDAAEELKISSVFSVGGNTSKPDSTPAPASNATRTNARPGPKDGSGQAPVSISELYRVTCNHCKKTLMKGQTAYQRKGCPDLFCSTTCLSATTGPKPTTGRCHCCFKIIERPQDRILSPVDEKGTTKEFCSDLCLSTFNRVLVNKNLGGGMITSQPPPTQTSLCSVCKNYAVCKHEVLHNGLAHKICTDVCFVRFRVINNLNLANCANCGSFCLNNPITLKLEDGSKTICKAECLAMFKKRIKTPCACIMCNTFRTMSDMLDGEDNEGKPALFCNSNCVMAYKIKVVSTSGVQYPCDNCGKVTTPTYHLAMSDASIRNFCTLNCVMTYQDKFNKIKNVGNGASLAKVSSTNFSPAQPMKVFPNSVQPNSVQPSTNVPQPKNVPPTQLAMKLPCFQCHKVIRHKPHVFHLKDKVVFLCSLMCSQEYQRIKCVAGLCEYCKIPKIIREVKRINNKDCQFCSEGCKLLYNHDLAKVWGIHCRCCAYCLSTTRNVMTSFYGGKSEEFCSEECRSQFVLLFYGVAKCHLCSRQGKLKECLTISGEVKYFCDLQCLLQHCHNVMQTQSGARPTGHVPQYQSTSLGTQSLTKTIGHPISTQTDPVRPAPLPPTKILKNKALLCRPMVQNKGITCKVNTVNAEAQTTDAYPKVLVLPVPVPVFLPVPMNMYSQYTPQPVALPMPVPVPMFLPVATANAERLVKTIREIKDKIPSDPLEADLILMAEMVAEQDKDGGVEKERKEKKQHGAYIPDDTQASNYSDDLDTDDFETLLNIWDDPNLAASNRTPRAQERSTDMPMSVPEEPEPPQSPPPPTPPPVLDVEADFPAETLELISAQLAAQLKRQQELQQQQEEEMPKPSTAPTRRQAPRRARAKAKARRSRRYIDEEEEEEPAVIIEPPKLEGKYGIDAWRYWIQRREKPSKPERTRGRSFNIEPKEDILGCTTVELAFGLCHFISEVRRPNGERYSPDSLYYLCLCIQHHLFENGRVENIFTDIVYSKFAMEISRLLKDFTPTVTANGYIHSRVEEEYLWECKQLGAYSPTVLLNTLLFFCCKHFGFTTVEQNRQLSFAHLMRCTRTDPKNSNTSLLRFYPPLAAELVDASSTSAAAADGDGDGAPAAKRRKEDETKESEVTLEMAENRANPLRCPVRLYEFYLSKCSESVKQRANMFYLLPERSCVPTSPLWFSTTPLDDDTMQAMLTRILTVREMLRLRSGEAEAEEEASQRSPDDPLFIPEDEDSE